MYFKFKAYCFLIGFFFIGFQFIWSQDQKVADSLEIIYKKGQTSGIARLELLRNLSFNQVNDLDAYIKYAEELIMLSKAENNFLYLYRGYLQKGNAHRLAGNLDLALENFFMSIDAAIKAEYKEGEGIAKMTVADTYSEMGNSNNASIYYEKAITILRETDNIIALASALLNAGDEAFNTKNYELALQYFEESGALFKEQDYLIGTGYNLGNMGMVYAEQGKDALAKSNINEAIAILEELEDYYAISEYLTYMADIYLKQGNPAASLNYAERSLELAEKYGLKKQISESNLKLAELHEQLGDLPQSYAHYKNHIIYRDSFINLENVASMADMRTNFEVSQKQTEVNLLNQQKRNQLIILGFTGLLLLTLFWYYRNISKEKKRSEDLLLNILPEETARELKKSGKVKAKKFAAVTVMFTDFVGFTRYAESLDPEILVESVNFYFSKFDEIMETYGLEKIKTIGDAYMSAGGLEDPKSDHALRMVKAAFDILEFVKASRIENHNNFTRFDIRIGINTGPVVAGVVGTKKFSYDIWGDSVNIASRMESHSAPGQINIGHTTYNLIKEDYDCECRGKLQVKNRGKMKMYWVHASKNV
ncbi:class 3 adenylate cyclase [Gillisia sp. Hel_I_86]|uniref:adenylate/guanylate cyclase domain-containing protein n=1 Tax=Gillisia sp. Hel_I_86 TaxID=1249981 RepID=UPI001199651B|nr:adenylate/guanylate cyclase domain-containing protein [Gillisia sp. Hel_I_86]TVZ28294.1 class 3 adenylate cyclase [Gillisia sp. Hel_I_86]